MSVATMRGADRYRAASVEAASPVELVVMLYDGALRFIGQAREAIERRDVSAKGEALSRVIAIVGELQATLDMEQGGEIAASLHRLYAYVMDCLLSASVNRDVVPLDDAARVLATLREGWAGLAKAEVP